MEQTPRGALIYLFLNAPGRYFSRFFERKVPWGEPTTTREGVRKGPAAEAERDASQHAVGGIAWVFFSLHIYSPIQVVFFTFVSRPVDSTRPDQQSETMSRQETTTKLKRRQIRSKSYGTWGQKVKRPRKNNNQNKNKSKDTTQYKRPIFSFLETPLEAPSALFLF